LIDARYQYDKEDEMVNVYQAIREIRMEEREIGEQNISRISQRYFPAEEYAPSPVSENVFL